MAILMMFEAKGATEEQYHATNDHLGIHGDEDAPDGLVSHIAGLTGDGVLVVDVWESQEKLDTFFRERLAAALEAAGLDAGEPTILPVHAMFPQGAGTNAGTIVVIDVDGFTTDAYDAMASTMDAHVSTGGHDHPSVQHVAAARDGGLLVVDVWGSPEEFGAFAETQIGPAAVGAGVDPATIQPKLVPVINRIRGKAAVAG